MMTRRIVKQITKLTASALLLLTAMAFGPAPDCMQELKDIYRRMGSVADEGSVILLDYTVNTTLTEEALKKGVKTAPSNVKIILSKGHSRCISKEMSYYQDEKNAFTVIPSRKLIYWSNSTDVMKNDRAKQLSMLQDTLFSVSRMIECRKEEGQGYNRCIVLQPNEKAQKAFGISRMAFYISDTKEEIKKVVITYRDHEAIAQLEIVYNKVDYDYKQEDIKKPVKDLFIQGKNKLSPTYRHYTLVDNRARK